MILIFKARGLFGARVVWGKGCSDAADTRPITGRWQREKSVKMMNSLKGGGSVNGLRDKFAASSRHRFRTPSAIDQNAGLE
jgi:hypothetical protein